MPTLDTGRPIKRKGKKAAKKREQARSWYQSLSDTERDAYVARRSKSSQLKAERKRQRKDKVKRNAYHRELTSRQHAAEASGKMKQAHKCARCGSGKDVQFHHTGNQPTRGRYLCAKCNNRAKPTK